MNPYPLIKTLHIINGAILFGAGLSIAFFMFFGQLNATPAERAFAARMTVRADWTFTLPTVLIQPVSGAWMIWHAGWPWHAPWLVATYVLYLVAGLCWIPVVLIQIRLKNMLIAHAAGAPLETTSYRRLFRWWFALGCPAFAGLVVVFWLMVNKPT